MSSTSSSEERSTPAPSPSGKPSGMGVGMMLAMVVLGTWIGVGSAGGVVYELAKSGRISFGSGSAADGAASKTTRSVTLEPILANLADQGGHAFVRVGLRVEIEGDAEATESSAAGAAEGSEAKAGETGKVKASGAAKASGSGAGNSNELESSIRDTVLAVLGRQTSATLLGPDGKEHLKIELKEAIERGAVRVNVKDLFFTDFLVQV